MKPIRAFTGYTLAALAGILFVRGLQIILN